MRRTSIWIMACLTLTLFGGCLESKETVVLKADGSGTISGSYVADLGKLRELIDMARMLFPQEAEGVEVPDALPNPFAKSWFDKAAGKVKGLTIKKATTVEKDGIRTSALGADFTTLEAAAKGGAFFASTVRLEAVKEPAPKDAPKKPVTTGGGGDGGDGDDGADRPKAWKLTLSEAWLSSMGGFEPSQILPGFEGQLEKLSITRTFKAPSKVLSTNGKLAEDGKTVTWTITYKKIIDGKDLTMEAVFENTAEMKLKPFAYNPDIMSLTPRFTQQPPKAAEKATLDGAEAPKKDD